jgi:hypothetical protein
MQDNMSLGSMVEEEIKGFKICGTNLLLVFSPMEKSGLIKLEIVI